MKFRLIYLVGLFCITIHIVSAGLCFENPVSEHNFPDTSYIVAAFSNLIFGNLRADNCDTWDCVTGKTGRGCTDECYDTPDPDEPCAAGERWQSCDPPLRATCVSCQRNGVFDTLETLEGGYSFGLYDGAVERYDLLNRRGSFEYAKIYPDSMNNAGDRFMTTRVAIENLPPVATTPLVLWNDVMFPGVYIGLKWYGVGTMKLVHGQGALHSDVFLELRAPYAQLLIAGIETSSEFQQMNYIVLGSPVHSVPVIDHIRGMVYEFQYRQRVYTDNIDVTFTAALSTGLTMSSTLIQVTELLPSRIDWTRHVGMLDYAVIPIEAVVPNNACLRLEFEMGTGKHILIDDVRVFANLIGNGRFTRAGSWSFTSPPGNINPSHWPPVENTRERAILGPAEAINQQVHLRTDTGLGNHKETAKFLMSVKGNGLLLVTSSLGEWQDEIVHFRKQIANVYDGDDLDNIIWQTISFHIVLQLTTADSRVPSFKIEHIGTMGVLKIDNVIMHIDPRGCPPNTDSITHLVICDDPVHRAFINGRCEPCETDDGEPVAACGAGMYQTGCTARRGGMQAECANCIAPVGPSGMAWEGEFEIGSLECTYKCAVGFYYDRGVNGPLYGPPSTYIPSCTTCTPKNELKCPTGWYITECQGSDDRTCSQCGILDPHDSSVVYTTTGVSTNQAEGQCPNTCAPGHFQYGMRSTGFVMGVIEDGGNIPRCFRCTPGTCGAYDNGISAHRFRDGFQYTSECSATKDSQCVSCESSDEKLLFTHNGRVAGEWCAYECLPGYRQCVPCAWDTTQALDVSPSLESRWAALFGQGNITGNILLDPWLIVRFTGSVTVSSAAFGVQAVLRVRVESTDGDFWNPPDETGVVVRIFPVVPSATVASTKMVDTSIQDAPLQQFDATVEMRDFINTASFNTWNAGRSSTGTALHLVYALSLQNGIQPYSNISVSDFTVHKMTLASDCCEIRNVSAQYKTPLDPIGLQRCYPCENSQTPSTLPANAHWERANHSCAWACDHHYELTTGDVCRYCIQPICPTGTYWTACGRCEHCTPIPPTNAAFTANGTTRHDPTSCPFKCADGFYHHQGSGTCMRCSNSTELACSTSLGGPFFEVQCTESQDALCMNCFICPTGSNATTACGRTNNVVCEECDMSLLEMPGIGFPGGAEWRLGETVDQYCAWGCMSGLQYNPLENTCFACINDNCPVGFYPTPCTLENLFTPCSPCNTPTDALLVSAGSMSLINSCAWECSDDRVYNRTLNSCIPRVVDPVQRLDAEWKQEPGGGSVATPVSCGATLPSVCEWGQWLDTTVVISYIVTNASGMTTNPCTAMCANCATPPLTGPAEGARMYTHRGSCEWTCSHPFIQIGGKCLRITTQMR